MRDMLPGVCLVQRNGERPNGFHEMFNICRSLTWLPTVACSPQKHWLQNLLAAWVAVFLAQAKLSE
jgi:hypothetical protein